jgi:hypothetical protein
LTAPTGHPSSRSPAWAPAPTCDAM